MTLLRLPNSTQPPPSALPPGSPSETLFSKDDESRFRFRLDLQSEPTVEALQIASAALLALFPWILIAQVQEWFRPVGALWIVLVATYAVLRLAWHPASRKRLGALALVAGIAAILGVVVLRLALYGVSDWLRPTWALWLIAVGAHALWMSRRLPRSRWVPVASFTGIIGFLAIQLLLVWQNIAGGNILRDYFNYMTLISLAARDFTLSPHNLIPLLQIPYLQYSFDPVIPLLDRVIPLTSSPFYLLGFQTLALFAPGFVLWAIAVRDATLRPFHFFLPVVYLLLPAVAPTIQTDYHTSGIGTSLLLLGTFLVFARISQAWIPLVVGTLTKVSYWPSFFMFSVVSLLYRRWRAAALYAAGFVAAIALYQHLQTVPSYSLAQFYGYLGSSPLEILHTMVTRPDVVLAQVLQTDKWVYLLRLLLPLGFGPLLFLPALLPTAPLLAMSFLDSTTWRSLMTSEYTLEYTPFLFAAELIVLKLAGPRRRAILVVLATAGTVASLFLYQAGSSYSGYWSPPLISRVQANMTHYLPEVHFVDCAMGDGTVLVTRYNWATFLRRDYDRVRFDEGALDQQPTPEEWAQFSLLVFPTAPIDGGNVLNFSGVKQNVPAYNTAAYAALRRRLPVLVDAQDYYYEGGDQLAACAQQFGYPIIAGQ